MSGNEIVIGDTDTPKADERMLRDRAIRTHFKRPSRRHPDETDEMYAERRAMYEKTGRWPNYSEMPGAKIIVRYGLPSTYHLSEEQLQELLDKGVTIDETVLAFLERGNTIDSIAKSGAAAGAVQKAGAGAQAASVLMEDGRKVLKAMGVEDPDGVDLGELALSVARAALMVAAQGMTRLSAERLVHAAQRSVQIAQLLSGKPTSVVGVLKPEVAQRLIQISEMLKDAEGEVIEGEFTDDRA